MEAEQKNPIQGRLERFLGRRRTAWSRYGAVILVQGTLISVSLAAGQRPHVPMSFLYLAGIVLVAFYGGLGPSVTAGLISSFAIDYFYVEPVGTVLSNWASLLVWIGVLGIALFLSFLTNGLKLAYQNARRDQNLAEEATRAREHTLAVVSHDLRQPLTTIALEMQLLLKTQASAQAERTLKIVSDMQTLIQDLLDASKGETLSHVLKLEPCDPKAVLRSCVDSFCLQAEHRGIGLAFDTEVTEFPMIRGDERRMRQMLANVLDNALKFTPERGTVRVLLERGPSSIEIRIFDSGPGIPKENLSRIFDRNWQARDTAHLGSGLGLYIARGIALAHGGQIWAVPQTRRGACIAIRLPTLETENQTIKVK